MRNADVLDKRHISMSRSWLPLQFLTPWRYVSLLDEHQRRPRALQRITIHGDLERDRRFSGLAKMPILFSGFPTRAMRSAS